MAMSVSAKAMANRRMGPSRGPNRLEIGVLGAGCQVLAPVTLSLTTRQIFVKFLSIPAMVFGVALAILFFNVYGAMSRPSVPLPVAVVVGQFAPGVEIGARVTEARHGVAAMS